MDEIASTTMIAVLPTGAREHLRIVIGRPERTEHGDWCCHASGEPLLRFPDVGIRGSDSMQALALAMSLVVGQLNEFLADGGKLVTDDGEEDDYPLDALFGPTTSDTRNEHDDSLPHVAAHRHSSNHKDEIEKSTLCGCFHCLETFPPSKVTQWVDDTDGPCRTALCPNCGVDAVIGDASGFPVQSMLLRRMNAYWFNA